MTKPMIAVIALLTAGHFAAAEAASVPGKEIVPCNSQSPGGDMRVFKCSLGANGTTQRYRFTASFSGGHDDTSASMTFTLDGSPLLCEAGSKTRLFGEDGDVGLECRFQVKEKSGAKLVLGVTLLWSHAQYVSAELAPE